MSKHSKSARASAGVFASQNRPLTLALQGGGAHGAFTWGVLDRLLEDERLSFTRVSGVSAGAINAALMADGFAQGGREGARRVLTQFWRAVSSQMGGMNPMMPNLGSVYGAWMDLTPMPYWIDAMTQVFSPYQFNPFNLNPLRDVLANTLSLSNVRHSPLKIVIGATDVQNGHLTLFSNDDISLDVLLASACLPHVHQAVEVGGASYWDGGFIANPPLKPLVDGKTDILLVRVTPVVRAGVPTNPRDILDRMGELTFNAALARSLSALEGKPGIFLHGIDADDHLATLPPRTKYTAEWAFLSELRNLGRQKADRWLADEFLSLGHAATLDLAPWEGMLA